MFYRVSFHLQVFDVLNYADKLEMNEVLDVSTSCSWKPVANPNVESV
jgi:hypothetical protein